ncbi:MAG TPA: threonine ammonia-lyase [Gaiellaceae bacterium]|nr:threonine ammonia-lyase [Gaiellaceae bacterium]
MKTGTHPSLRDVEEARGRLVGVARETPVYVSESFERMTGREVWLKAENLQRTGSFKIRGAGNCIAMLSEAERAAGVVAASAGNHAQAVAWAAREAGIEARIFMPEDTPVAKVEATQNYGARIELGGEMFDDAHEAAQAFAETTGATFVHPFEDERVIAGQGTIGLELVEQLPDVGTVVVPIGGGGLAAGISSVVKELKPSARVVGVQAAACAPFAGESEVGFTIAEGIAVKRPGELTASIVRDRVDDVVTVTDEEISKAIVLLLERAKLVVEGAGAAPLAALLADRVGGTGPVAVVLSGGNIDASLLITVMRHGLTLAGRYLVLRSRVPDRPGELVKLLTLIAQERVNVVSVEHHREGMQGSVAETEVELTLATRDKAHAAALVEAMERWGYPVESVR